MTTKKKFSLTFFIRRHRVLYDGKYPIYVRIKLNETLVDVSTGLTVQEDLWSSENGFAVGKSKEVKLVNDSIDRIKSEIIQNYQNICFEGDEITAKSIKNAWLGIAVEEKTLCGIFTMHNEKAEQLRNIEYTGGTIQKFETVLRHLKDFLKKNLERDDIPLRKINPEFISNFDFYLRKTRNCEQNSVVKYMRVIKKLMRFSMANGWITKDPFVNYKMIIKPVDRGFLTEEEIDKIRNHMFVIERLEHVRDVFIVGCFTGLAYCDLKQLSPENLITDSDGKQWIHTKRQKTDSSCHIPLLRPSKEIVEKYMNHPHCQRFNVLLPVYSNQKQNAYLKEIGDLCGIQKELSTHLARHTFATTVTLNNDVPIETVSKMLGHSTIKITRIYARLLDKKIGQDMSRLNDKY